jgi:hypothetical protein
MMILNTYNLDLGNNIGNNSMSIVVNACKGENGAEIDSNSADMGINVGNHHSIDLSLNPGLDIQIDLSLGLDLELLDIDICNTK